MSNQSVDYNTKINKTTDESLEATRRIKALAIDTQGVGASTMEELDRQGDQLNAAEKNLDVINEEMNDAETHIDNLNKFCGLCLCPWNRKIRDTKYGVSEKKVKSKSKDGKVTYGDGKQAGEAQGSILRVTNDAREDEMDENLGEVGDIALALKHMAVDMGNELDRQNDQIDRMNKKTDQNTNRITAADKQAQKILEK